MSITQNEKICQVAKQTLVVGVDIASEEQWAREASVRKMLAAQIPLSDIARYTDVPLNAVERISRVKS